VAASLSILANENHATLQLRVSKRRNGFLCLSWRCVLNDTASLGATVGFGDDLGMKNFTGVTLQEKS
jgi:hypothetical protein